MRQAYQALILLLLASASLGQGTVDSSTVCPQYCKTCDQIGKCTECLPFRFLNDQSICVSCKPYCSECKGPTDCQLCGIGYVLNKSTQGCSPCQVENCFTCSTLDTCDACSLGYRVDANSTSCIAITREDVEKVGAAVKWWVYMILGLILGLIIIAAVALGINEYLNQKKEEQARRYRDQASEDLRALSPEEQFRQADIRGQTQAPIAKIPLDYSMSHNLTEENDNNDSREIEMSENEKTKNRDTGNRSSKNNTFIKGLGTKQA